MLAALTAREPQGAALPAAMVVPAVVDRMEARRVSMPPASGTMARMAGPHMTELRAVSAARQRRRRAAGSHGSGGGGYGNVSTTGGAGGAGIGWVQTSDGAIAGPGGGGGAGGGNAGVVPGANGGLYGGGAGGCGYNISGNLPNPAPPASSSLPIRRLPQQDRRARPTASRPSPASALVSALAPQPAAQTVKQPSLASAASGQSSTQQPARLTATPPSTAPAMRSSRPTFCPGHLD